MCSSVRSAIQNPAVTSALSSGKLSRERIGIEVDKMVSRRPFVKAVDALRLMEELGLLRHVLGGENIVFISYHVQIGMG